MRRPATTTVVNRSRRRQFAANLVLAVGMLAIVAGVASLFVYWHHVTATQQVPPHIKVRIGNWYTRHIGRWT